MQMDGSVQKQLFLPNVINPLGCLIEKDVFYCVNNRQCVTGFSLQDHSRLFEIKIPEARFLNDLTSDGNGRLYTTDSQTGKVFCINMKDTSFTVLFETGFRSLNGIFYDANRNRLLVCDFSPEGKVGQYDVETEAFSLIAIDLGENLDGITADASGFYISSWGPGSFETGFQKRHGKIWHVDAAFQELPEVIAENLYGPADIFYSSATDSLVSPNALENTVDIICMDQSAKGDGCSCK